MKALVVDDNADIRLLLERILAMAGLQVEQAEGGGEAIQMIQSGMRPSVILLDVQMPDMDGWETLRAVRESPAGRDVPVILCTVKGSPADIARGWDLGCDGYVSKPFDVKELIAEIRSVTARGPGERDALRTANLSALPRPSVVGRR